MSPIPRPGPARITLVLLAVIPAVLAYPWRSTRDYWLIGIAVVVVVALFGWWRGLHFTTILRRRLALLLRRRPTLPESESGTRITALLRIGPPSGGADVLPLPLLAQYLDRYGIRADAVRITNRDNASGERVTWVGLTVSAVDNLSALQARSSRIPLRETAQVAARRLADHLREIGWEATTLDPDDVPQLVVSDVRETWCGVQDGSDYLAAYRVTVDGAVSGVLAAIGSRPARETWSALEIGGGPEAGYTVAIACAFRTDTAPQSAAPLAGLTPQHGRHWSALMVLDPLSAQRLDGHTRAPDGLLTGLGWPTPGAGAHRAPLAH
ncbi:MAG: type VII secretion protein EccE [Mycobacterium sp.]|uniref:type VII secretion protein EccE n=1 Tax=Mycobacterium sp. TaxID=1785 RepID=UPI001EBA7B51|nr:type VII secretion protein EccE [Mycobacterium sp.]MBW0017863.1 type VII secretion protein EccE [Mycobacterium sp.]